MQLVHQSLAVVIALPLLPQWRSGKVSDMSPPQWRSGKVLDMLPPQWHSGKVLDMLPPQWQSVSHVTVTMT